MANVQKPDMTNIWASGGARVEPTEAKQLEGWVVEPPPHQWENWSQWRQDSALAHIFQKGVPLWDDKTSFHEGGSSYVQGSDGKIYISLQRSGGSVAARNPATAGNTAFWKVAFTTSDERIAQSRITNLATDLGKKASTSYVNTEMGKKLTKSDNLSDLTNVTTARANLGLGSSSVYPISDSVTLNSSVSVASSKAVKTLNDSKANKTTKVIAGTGLTGGGDLSTDKTLNVSYGVVANTSAQGNDSRLSNSREWTGATISKAEAEAGTATTRRAFTAQRVRQATVAWWNSITGVFGRDLVTSGSNTVARSKLGLDTLVVPTGAVISFAMPTAPTGWLKADGAAVSRTTYAALFAAVGTTFGAGNGSTTFNLPDLRGEFIRGWDDGRGVDAGRTFGDLQHDSMQKISGEFEVLPTGSTAGLLNKATGAFYGSGLLPDAGLSSWGEGERAKSLIFDSARQTRTSDETRPINRSLLYCIKY